MVKCVVSGCRNRKDTLNREIYSRPPKRFFSFPKDPARVKVWLAALRETDKHDSAEQHLICEDHFLPDDITTSGVSGDAIPIMPPCLDRSLSMMNPWGVESSDDEEQWNSCRVDAAAAAAAGVDSDYGSRPLPHDAAHVAHHPAVHPTPHRSEQEPEEDLETPPEVEIVRVQSEATKGKPIRRADMALGKLARRFLELLGASPDGSVDLRVATTSLQTRKRRVYDITNVLDGISLIQRESANIIKWIGQTPISAFLERKRTKFERELDNLKLVEDMLDTLIKTCAKQLFEMTDDTKSSAWAYVTHEDICKIPIFQGHTVIAVRAPEETTLEVPAPKEENIQIRLRTTRGPISVCTSEVERPGDDVTYDHRERSGLFRTLEESRIKTSALKK
ncbi:transcription factor E2F6 [Genypterus blacodes]|uniref:transcription factor E2F6 n=1 Tax=Genypterus blacodes TaxID=154954 RepID=UPI003F75EF38